MNLNESTIKKLPVFSKLLLYDECWMLKCYTVAANENAIKEGGGGEYEMKRDMVSRERKKTVKGK